MMIYLYTPYFNEKIIMQIRAESDAQWASELHICETNYTFKKKYKDYNFPEQFKEKEFIHYHPVDMKYRFVPDNKIGKLMLAPYRMIKDTYYHTLAMPAWYNEGVQRNQVSKFLAPKDDDFVIVSDVDEILSPECVKELLECSKRYGIATCRLYFTMYYFNLFVKEWGGPEGYSYRLFAMTGKFFNNLNISSDMLRKKGERGQLYNDVYLLDKFCGFHHSWLGDSKAVADKLHAYAHSESEHRNNTAESIADCVHKGKNIVNGAELSPRDDVKLIDAVEKLREQHKELFWEA